jgi:site-specific DNA-cytosine methylase
VIIKKKIRHGHLFCGLGGGAKGFNRGQARVKNFEADFECVGGIDHDAAALRDFERMAGVPGTCMDLFSRDQFVTFHGHEPPRGWVEAQPVDVRRAFGFKHPHIVFLSAPCKGFSGLLAEKTAKTAKYQALNGLTLRGVWLALEAYKDDPVELFIFENVPRIATRGRPLLDQIKALFRGYGYAVEETTHDCGELGELGQSRKRFLLVARHMERVPPFLYQPPKKKLLSIGDILDKLPLPGGGVGGPMHRMPSLHWKTWVRLAFVEAGSDWRSLNRLAVEDGQLRDFGIIPEQPLFNSAFNVHGWGETGNTVTSKNQPSSGATSVADPRYDWDGAHESKMRVQDYGSHSRVVTGSDRVGSGALSVADPRVEAHPNYNSVQLGVRKWGQTGGVVTTKMVAGGGGNSVADPRILDREPFNHAFRIVPYGKTGSAVTGAGGAMAPGVADPRPAARSDYTQTKYRVTRFHGEASGTVIAASTGDGAFAVADPRPVCLTREGRDGYHTQGHYGVQGWQESSGAVPAFAKNNNGAWSVADPRPVSIDMEEAPEFSLPQASDKLVCVIRALDDTWHRPLTTLELASLQSLVDPEEFLALDGLSDSAWRERIGNAVPPKSATAIANVMGKTLLMAWSGETFTLSNEPIWVQPIALALTMPGAA